MNAQRKNNSLNADNVTAKVLTAHDVTAPERKSISDKAFAIAVRKALFDKRQGTVGCQGRSDVKHSNKKPWKQKGTGRARAGSARSPLWRGGGVIFGPQPRTRTLRVPAKMHTGVMNELFWQMLSSSNIIVLSWQLQNDRPCTQEIYQVLKKHNLLHESLNVMLPIDDFLHAASFANIPNVSLLSFDQANAYDLANARKWIILEKDLTMFSEVVQSWI